MPASVELYATRAFIVRGAGTMLRAPRAQSRHDRIVIRCESWPRQAGTPTRRRASVSNGEESREDCGLDLPSDAALARVQRSDRPLFGRADGPVQYGGARRAVRASRGIPR